MILVLTGIDQLTKLLARQHLQNSGNIEILYGLTLRFAKNPGAFLSLGAGFGSNARLAIFTIGVAVFLLYAGYKVFFTDSLKFWENIGFLFLITGGLGNWIDRVFSGSVTDFIILHAGPLTTGIFNFADMYIVAGVIVLVFERRLHKFWSGWPMEIPESQRQTETVVDSAKPRIDS